MVRAPRKGRLPAPSSMETRFDELRRYVRFGREDADALVAFRPVAAPHFARIVQQFYDRIREHEDAHAVFTSEEQIQRLQTSLVRWLERLLGGVYDEAYFEQTSNIGRVHVRVGLPQRYMFTAMALIRVELLHLAELEMGERSLAVRDAVSRLLDLELGIMLEAYRSDLVVRMEKKEADIRSTLAKGQRRYVDAVENARVMIVGMDAGAKVSLFNAEAERVTGFGREEVLGGSFVELLLPSDLVDTDGAQIREAASGERSDGILLDSLVRTRSGKVRDVRWSFAQAAAEDDEVALFAVGQDTTDERIARDHAKHHERLAAVGTLAAGLAHEIRNPLNGAQLHVAFLERSLEKSGASPDMVDAIHVVGEEITRLAQLVSEFLDFARPRPLALRPVGVIALCDRTRSLLLAQAEAARVQIVSDLPPSDVVIMADGPRLEQVLLNLAQNAVEAMAPVGGGVLTLRARRQPRHVRIDVEDTGPGIPSADAPIFDAFYSTKPSGTGLGLAIVHSIVTDHQGTIHVESHPGKTTFRVLLPIEARPSHSVPTSESSKGSS
jgi:PAS domain S-box-containing protein